MVTLLRSQQNEIETLKKQQASLKTHIDMSFDQIQARAAAAAQKQQQYSTVSKISDESTNALALQYCQRLEKCIKDEIRGSIQPQVMSIVEPFREQIPNELAEKLKATENVLKDTVSKLFKSKTLLDSNQSNSVTSRTNKCNQ